MSSGATTFVFWDVDDFPIPYMFNPYLLYYNINLAVKDQGLPGELGFYFYVGSKERQLEHYPDFRKEDNFTFFVEDSGNKHERAKRTMRDILLMAVDMSRLDPDEVVSVFVVSDKVSTDELMISVLQKLESRNIKVLLALTEPNPSGMPLPSVSFEWLWRKLLADTRTPSSSLCSRCSTKIVAKPMEDKSN